MALLLGCGVALLMGCSGSDVAFDGTADGATDATAGDGTAEDADASGADTAPTDGTPTDGDTGGLPDGGCAGTLCGGRCTNTKADPANCGACGTACPDSDPACIDGKCGCPAGGTCGGSCVDLASDFDHCGSCDAGCSAGETCVAGSCACNLGTTRCGSECVDTKGNPRHCGACGKPCKSGELCSGGACLPTGKGCGPGLTVCPKGGSGPYSCVDLKRSNTNCGECERACDADQACIAGECRDLTPGAFCKTCPCPTCTGDVSKCCAPLLAGANAFCVAGTVCPLP